MPTRARPLPRDPPRFRVARRDPKSIRPGVIDKRVQYTIEGLFAARKAGFADYPAVPDDLDLVERDDQITFELSLDDKVDREEALDVFKVDDDFEAHEAAWVEIKREILG